MSSYLWNKPKGRSPINRNSIIFLQIIILFFGVAALAFLLWEPQVEGVNKNRTNFEVYFQDPLLAIVYTG